MILGLTGPNAAGKGEAANYLASLGFAVHSLSDIIREEAAAAGFPPEREHLIRIGNALRAEGGAGVLATKILDRLENRDVVDSIRNPAEVLVLRSHPAFRLIGVGADEAIRFKRSVKRARPGDPATLEAFQAREQQENSSDPAAQQLAATFDLADAVVHNNGDLERMYRELDRLIGRFS